LASCRVFAPVACVVTSLLERSRRSQLSVEFCRFLLP
jgi:hypothetical protein